MPGCKGAPWSEMSSVAEISLTANRTPDSSKFVNGLQLPIGPFHLVSSEVQKDFFNRREFDLVLQAWRSRSLDTAVDANIQHLNLRNLQECLLRLSLFNAWYGVLTKGL